MALLATAYSVAGCCLLGPCLPEDDGAASSSTGDEEGFFESAEFQAVLSPPLVVEAGEAPRAVVTICVSPAPASLEVEFSATTRLTEASEGGPPEVFVRLTDPFGALTTLVDGPNEDAAPREFFHAVDLTDDDLVRHCEVGSTFAFERIDPETTGIVSGDLLVDVRASWEDALGEVVIAIDSEQGEPDGTGGSDDSGGSTG